MPRGRRHTYRTHYRLISCFKHTHVYRPSPPSPLLPPFVVSPATTNLSYICIHRSLGSSAIRTQQILASTLASKYHDEFISCSASYNKNKGESKRYTAQSRKRNMETLRQFVIRCTHPKLPFDHGLGPEQIIRLRGVEGWCFNSEDVIVMLRKILLVESRGDFVQSMDVMRYLRVKEMPSLLGALHRDAKFVEAICVSGYTRGYVVRFLRDVPSSGLSVRAVLSVAFEAATNHIHRDQYCLESDASNCIKSLEAMQSVLDREGEAVVFTPQDSDVLRMVVEDALSRLGIYSCSLPMNGYERVGGQGGRPFVTASRTFMAIPCETLRGRHLRALGAVYYAGSPEWRQMMRKVARVLSRRQSDVQTCLHQAWNYEWTRLPETERAFDSISAGDLRATHIQLFQDCFLPFSPSWFRMMQRVSVVLRSGNPFLLYLH